MIKDESALMCWDLVGGNAVLARTEIINDERLEEMRRMGLRFLVVFGVIGEMRFNHGEAQKGLTGARKTVYVWI